MQDAYKRAFYARALQIWGTRLGPITLGHLHVLEVNESPLVRDGATCTVEQLIWAVWILSKPTDKAMETARLRLADHCLPRITGAASASPDLRADAELLRQWVAEQYDTLHTLRKDNVKSPATPLAYSLAIRHRLLFGGSASETWTVPIAVAALDCITAAHLNGQVDLVRDSYLKSAQILKQMAAEKAARKRKPAADPQAASEPAQTALPEG